MSNAGVSLIMQQSAVSQDVLALSIQLMQLLGSRLTGLWIGEDLLSDGFNNVTSWPGRVGGTAAVYSAGVYRTSSTLNGKKSSSSTNVDLSGFLIASQVHQAVFAVASASVPFDNYRTIVRSTFGGLMLVGTQGSDQLYTVTGTSTSVDGVATTTVTNGAHIFYGVYPSPVTATMAIGCNPAGASRTWLQQLACIVTCGSTPNSVEKSAVTQALAEYYKITLPA